MPLRVRSLAAINGETSDEFNVSATKNEETPAPVKRRRVNLSENRSKQESHLAAAVTIGKANGSIQENHSMGQYFSKVCRDEENNLAPTEGEIIDFHFEQVQIKQEMQFVDVESVEGNYFGSHSDSLSSRSESSFRADPLSPREDGKENYDESNAVKIRSKRNSKNHASVPGNIGQMSCPYCQMEFNGLKRTEYSLHLRTHGESPLLCPVCPAKFRQQQKLTNHLKCQHLRIPGKTVYQCESCEARFHCAMTFAGHLRSLHTDRYFYRAMCKDCLSKLEQDRHLKHLLLMVRRNQVNAQLETSRQNIADNSEQDPLSCETETDRNVNSDESETHSLLAKNSQNNRIEKEPLTNSAFFCPRCSAEFVRKLPFENHLLTHHPKRAFQCPDCPKFYKSERDFYSHWAHHKGELAYHCDFCPSRFSLCCESVKHFKTVHFDKYWSFDKNGTTESEEGREKLNHRVDENDENSGSPVILSPESSIKIESVHYSSGEFCSENPSGKQFYTCKFCSMQYLDLHDLTNHLTAQHSNTYNDPVVSEGNSEQRFCSTPYSCENLTNTVMIQNSRDQKDHNLRLSTHSHENSTDNAPTLNVDIQNFHSAPQNHGDSGNILKSQNFVASNPESCLVVQNYEDSTNNVLVINANEQTGSNCPTNVQSYLCLYCSLRFMNRFALTKHLKTSHTDELHLNPSEQHSQLDKDGYSTTWDVTLTDLTPSSAFQLECASNTEKGLQLCHFCPARYSCENDLMRHLSVFHMVRPPSPNSNFDSEIKSTVDKPHEFQDFPLNEDLYSCAFCFVTFIDCSCLLKHLTTQHSDKYLDPELLMRESERKKKQKLSSTNTSTDFKHKCPNCPAEFIWVNSMINHMKTHDAGKPL